MKWLLVAPHNVSGSLQGHDESRSYTHVDRSHNVIVFGVPESRDMLGTEALVNRAFEMAVGRKVAVADYRRVGRFSAEASKSRPLLIRLASVWDRRLLLGSKYKLKGFTEAKLFVREDKPPAERKTSVRQSAVSAHVRDGSENNVDHDH